MCDCGYLEAISSKKYWMRNQKWAAIGRRLRSEFARKNRVQA